ncbi:MAG: hypothetical protein EHM64_04670 [Ignavibacteriae bacterium]|nr:MAG: hypothetical protein EHM64_04670 [Ignavibacteriota bacterium]
MHKKLSLSLLFGLIFLSSVHAQVIEHKPSDFRGDVNLRRYSNIDGNNIRATIFNSGYSGNPNGQPTYVNYEWPKNTGRIYIALICIYLGAEVVDNKGDTIIIVDVPLGRTNNATGTSWSLEPVSGFIDPQQTEIARSDRKSSWPNAVQKGWRDKRTDPIDPGWVGSWDGFFGKNIFNADQEFYYVTSDDLYKRNPYTPDTTDPSRGGLGLLMDVRTLAWSQILVNDIVFSIHDIKNDGTKTIKKMSFAMRVSDWVGGEGAPDDLPYVDLLSATTFLTDNDRRGSAAFGSDPVGVASLKYLETPGNQVNGIDDDGDSDDNPNLIGQISGNPDTVVPHFTAADFSSRMLHPGDKIVLIEPETYNRIITTYPVGGGTVTSLGKKIVLPAAGLLVAEDTLDNGFDDDFDGLIDEKQSLHLTHINELTQTTNPVRYINYLSFAVGDTIKRGFIVPGKNAAWNYQNVAPSIDESRDDGFDNDQDWDAFLDDVGLDGVRGTGDQGEGDGKPTSGVGTEFPGEPNIDKTDVSETDAIGITSAVQIAESAINTNTAPDQSYWNIFMTPGKINLIRLLGSELHTWVSSGYFPLLPGQRQRMAVSVAISAGGNTKEDDIQSVIKKQKQAELAYRADYQFAQAPLQVTLTAVPGDGKVTLYWDDIAEKSYDRFISKIGGNPRDFEGYRIYRVTDAAFLDAKTITDAYGVRTLMHPIAEFDLKDGIKGLHPIDINGVKFDLGTDNGLKHEYVDTNIINGQRYFYAVTAYDFGYIPALIPPTETPIQVNVATDGTITYGTNVAMVRPAATVAGYLPTEVEYFEHATGGASGSVGLRVVDPFKIKGGNEYELSFKDSVYQGTQGSVFVTKSYSLKNLTEDRFVVTEDTLIRPGDELPLTEGFRIGLNNYQLPVAVNNIRTGWNNPDAYSFDFTVFAYSDLKGDLNPSDYKLIVGSDGIATSKDTTIVYLSGLRRKRFPAKAVNFKIINVSQNKEIEFVFSDNDSLGSGNGRLSTDPAGTPVDAVYFLERDKSGSLKYTWMVTPNIKRGTRNPQAGDTASLIVDKPFLSSDTYRFKMIAMNTSAVKAKSDLDKTRVVPNPYVAASPWEPRNTFTSGRGPREIHFINLPAACTIRIFNVSGALVKKIDHQSTLMDGTAIWNVLSDENFEIAYGIYVYHIEAPGIGQKTGTFAIIK